MALNPTRKNSIFDKMGKRRQSKAYIEHEHKKLSDIMKSKTVLSFGYKSYLNYYYKMMIFNLFRCFSRCFNCTKCCREQKHSSMTARKYKRAQNAHKKISEELDLLQIVKTLRKARFMIDNSMTLKQQ